MRNPLKIGDLVHAMFRCFLERPFVGAKGEVIKVKPLVVPATMDSFYEHVDIHYVPLQVGF
jgi:fatty acyl-CoA reductase